MNRHKAYWPLDEAPGWDGDTGFSGVNARLDPDQLSDGEVADAVNMRFDAGVAEPRMGLRILPWGAEGFHGYSPGIIAPYGNVVTAGTFRDPINALEWMVVATETGTFRCRPGSTGMSIAGPAGMAIPAGSRLVQTYNGLVNRIPVTVPSDEVVSVLGYTAEGDWGAPRVAKYVSASVAATNLGCVFMPVTGVGRWVFQDCESGEVDIRWFGGTNTSASITAGLTKLLSRPTTINVANRSIYLADGVAATAAAGTLALYATNSLGHSVGLAHPGGSNELVATRSPTTGQISSNQLPGLLPGLSVGDGQGVLTNLAFPSVHWFTNQNMTTNWTIPTGAKSLRILGVSNGGGGGSGRRGAVGTVISGGGGGGGGAFGMVDVENVSTLWTNKLLFSILSIRAGGAAVTTDDSNGTKGDSESYCFCYVGASATSNALLVVASGNPGLGGDADGSAGGSGGVVGFTSGASGGASSITGGAGADGRNTLLGPGGAGGGAGGGIVTGGTPSSGGNSGYVLPYSYTLIASGGGVGTNGNSSEATWPKIGVMPLRGWPGAGGGGGSTNSTGGNGGNGYWFGSGGGGGGGSLNGFASGNGGDGGPGAFVVICY